MNIKLGHVMSSSRLICFVAFLAATFAWILKMPALFSVSALFLLISAIVYVVDLWKNQKKEPRSLRRATKATRIKKGALRLLLYFMLIALAD